jgi:hypothetical protein
MTEEKKTGTRKPAAKAAPAKKASTATRKSAADSTTRKTTTTRKSAPAQKAKKQAAAMVKIDGKDYPVDALSDQAKAQITNLRATDRHIEELEAELAIARTARGSYAAALERELKTLDKQTLQ